MSLKLSLIQIVSISKLQEFIQKNEVNRETKDFYSYPLRSLHFQATIIVLKIVPSTTTTITTTLYPT